jgi:hypothetical protein
MHTKGFATPETKAALGQARSLIEKAEALGEPTEDPLLLFSILYGFWATNYVGHNGGALRELASQFLALANGDRPPCSCGAPTNAEISRSLGAPSPLQMRLTSTDSDSDSDSVLQAVEPHFVTADGGQVPSKRQGSGLISLQSLFLLLH